MLNNESIYEGFFGRHSILQQVIFFVCFYFVFGRASDLEAFLGTSATSTTAVLESMSRIGKVRW